MILKPLFRNFLTRPALPVPTVPMPGMSRSEGTSVTVRLGKVESAERSEDVGAALRVFVGKRNASVSTSQLDKDSITELAERAVAMAKVAPEDPYVRPGNKRRGGERSSRD